LTNDGHGATVTTFSVRCARLNR